MLFDLAALQKNKSQKGAPTMFKLIQSQIGAENSNLGAMTVENIPNEIIKKYFDPKTDAAVIRNIQANGITYIAPTSKWRNSLFQSNRTSPTEALLNTGKKLQYIDPKYGHKVTLERDNVTGNYNYSTILRAIDENGEYYETKPFGIAQAFGKNIDVALSNIMSKISIANMRLKEDFDRFHNSNNEKAVKAFQDKFGKAPKNTGYNILD
jgi:peptidoglycan hydrolase-like protein with peptidoglycan-binding domain